MLRLERVIRRRVHQQYQSRLFGNRHPQRASTNVSIFPSGSLIPKLLAPEGISPRPVIELGTHPKPTQIADALVYVGGYPHCRAA